MDFKEHRISENRTTDLGKADKYNAALLDIRQVASLLNCSTRSVYRFCDAGRMPKPIKLGGLLRFHRQEIWDWINSKCIRCK